MPVHRFGMAGLLLAAVAVAGCSSGPEPGPVFAGGDGGEISCMEHQAEPPGARYTDPAMRDTAEVLAVMRYYTANGTRPYCDGAPPTAADRAWAQLYVDLDGAPQRVATVLG